MHFQHQIRRTPSRGHAYPWGEEGGGGGGRTVLEELEVAGLAALGVVAGRVQALRGVLQAGDREDDLVRVG